MLGKPLVRFCEGPGRNSDHGRDHVAPPGNQAANGEHKHRPTVREVPGLLETAAPYVIEWIFPLMFAKVAAIAALVKLL